MNPIKIVELRNFLNKDDANFKELVKDFTALLKLERALTEGWFKFEQQLARIADLEMNPEIGKIFHKVSTTYKDLNDSRKAYLELLDKKIIQSLNGQIQEVKDKRAVLIDYEKRKQIEDKKDLNQRMNSDAVKTNQMHTELEEARKATSTAAKSLTTKVRMYIQDKNAELKAMFQHFTNCQMVYHATGLEKLSELAQFIHRSDDEASTNNILESFLGITSKPSEKEQKEKENK